MLPSKKTPSFVTPPVSSWKPKRYLSLQAYLWLRPKFHFPAEKHSKKPATVIFPEALKKDSAHEKREGKGRFLGAFSKADSLRETLLERKNKKPRKVRHWKPNEVEEADFNSSTALGRLNSTNSLLGRLGIEPSHTKVESFAADFPGGLSCTKRNGEADVKCDGPGACGGINPDHVGCGSCNGEGACFRATGEFGTYFYIGMVA
ncbi:predicted protein [Thalassiosira pseudonana CCMP1335]|uniref:Uncharacterized protein n=1 Tax=Thalassiosira pseudonana TaxID=35128 RepID=B8CAI5_THAPS|nr:predicted protein [Thalassiosira pseudonana CCMP1335]EED89686.1 predicted protein [Thalassiosira pseudonana CCMP1335]